MLHQMIEIFKSLDDVVIIQIFTTFKIREKNSPLGLKLCPGSISSLAPPMVEIMQSELPLYYIYIQNWGNSNVKSYRNCPFSFLIIPYYVYPLHAINNVTSPLLLVLYIIRDRRRLNIHWYILNFLRQIDEVVCRLIKMVSYLTCFYIYIDIDNLIPRMYLLYYYKWNEISFSLLKKHYPNIT
jgi:hypothetical protein